MGAAGKYDEPLLASETADAGKRAERVAAVEVAPDNFLK